MAILHLLWLSCFPTVEQTERLPPLLSYHHRVTGPSALIESPTWTPNSRHSFSGCLYGLLENASVTVSLERGHLLQCNITFCCKSLFIDPGGSARHAHCLFLSLWMLVLLFFSVCFLVKLLLSVSKVISSQRGNAQTVSPLEGAIFQKP